MATEVEDTLAPSGISGSGVYGVDTASVKGDNASKPVTELPAVYTRDFLPSPVTSIHDTNEEILRLSVKGVVHRTSERKGEVVIFRAAQRKVALRLPIPLGRNIDRLYVVQSVFNDSSTNYIGLQLI